MGGTSRRRTAAAMSEMTAGSSTTAATTRHSTGLPGSYSGIIGRRSRGRSSSGIGTRSSGSSGSGGRSGGVGSFSKDESGGVFMTSGEDDGPSEIEPQSPSEQHNNNNSNNRNNNNRSTNNNNNRSTNNSYRKQPSLSFSSFSSSSSSSSSSALLSTKQKVAVFKLRACWTVILIAFFLLVLSSGHVYCSVLVLALIMGIYREIISLKRKKEKDKKLPLFFVLRWYWFAVTCWWLGVPWILPKLLHVSTYSQHLYRLQAYHSLCTYLAALGGFVLFILSLRRYTLRYQFGQLAIMLLTLIIVVAQSLIQIANIYRGIIWFCLPTSLVVVNDVSAYVFGSFFGKTKLIKLSPNKTVEGYVGASIVTVVWSLLFAWFLQQHKAFTCPQQNIVFRPFSMWSELNCPTNPIFELYNLHLPLWLSSISGVSYLTVSPMLYHALVLGIFAAFVAPFGGFFASGFKRAVKIKDFGDSIPGHGGITDRFDCQILMGMFTYVYIKTLLSPKASSGSSFLPSSVDEILQAVQLLSVPEQKDLLHLLQELLMYNQTNQQPLLQGLT
eukprot:GHVS01056117.1.p1 GENE.GHVS01056117.1~~GHVS01056117.1.p1  ORF type:complete len:555 (-),score=100.61 GHVS01056117.1:568-2232(-)